MTNTRLSVLWLIVGIGLPILVGAADDSPDHHYLVEFQVVVAVEERIAFTSRLMESDGVVTPASGVSTLTIGDLVLDLDKDDLWGGRPEPPEDAGITVLSMPQLIIPAGEKATLRSGGQTEIQYLEWQSENCYTVKTLPPEFPPGLLIEVASREGRPDDQPGTVYLDMKIQVTVVGERVPVRGLNLDVGKPAVQTNELNTHKRFQLGRWDLLTTQFSRELKNRDAETLLVFMRASRR